MPVPADVVRRKLREQLKHLDHEAKIALLEKTLEELPGYTSGPYGRLKNWIRDQISGASTRARTLHREGFMVKKEGDRTAVLVGAPNSGKSSLLRALTGRQVRVGDYPFTTLKPVAGMVQVHGASIQLVEVPGLIEGASEGAGSGRAFLSAVRAADIGVFVGELRETGLDELSSVRGEVREAGIEMPGFIIGSKCDLPGAHRVLHNWMNLLAGEEIIPASVVTGEGLDRVRQSLWDFASLVRVYPRGSRDEPVILPEGSTVADFAAQIHRELKRELVGARVWGASALFDGQPVSSGHVLTDGDEVLLKSRG